ncbi:MAG: PBP1A family penicillin-binding protein [Pseudomonadota bacterium]
MFRLASIAVTAAGLGVLTGFAVVTLSDLPEVSQLEHYEPKGLTVLKDVHGRVIHEFFTERRIGVPLESIPPMVRSAFLAAEDWRFYEHFGIDLKGLTRALFRNLVEGRYAEGASTITQQLSKVLFLTPEKTMARKLKEMMLALQIERRYSKNEILGLYMNQIYLGAGCYGVEAASRTYFGKGVKDLFPAEAALLAGLPKGPTKFSPFVDPAAARDRRDTVLLTMFERGVIRKDEYLKGKEEPLSAQPASDERAQSYFAAYILSLLSGEMGEEQVYRGHLDVETTMDLDLQEAAEEAVKAGLEAYARRRRIRPDRADLLPQAALLALDARTGEIRAMVGGKDFKESQFNRTIQAVRQPGSSIKPVLYAAALERGFTQSSPVEDRPISFRLPGGKTWSPKNYDKKYMGIIPLRVALEHSKNVVAVRLLKTIGIPAFRTMAQRLGIASPIAPNLSSALGSSSLKLVELARTFSVFDNGGIRPNVRAIRNVLASGGGNLWPSSIPSQPVLDPRIAYVMTDLLTGVVRFGTGVFAKDLPCAVAGKTGTTDDNVDSLFVGFSSDLVAVAWMGFDDRKSLGREETGAVAAGPIWKQFMETACEGAADEFSPPPGILLVDVDHSTGKLAGSYCSDVVTQAYLEGTQPNEVCSEERTP